MINNNLRFAVSVAKKYRNRGLSLKDLVAEGVVGLVRAAHKFDSSYRVRFITYATWWIRQSILQALTEQTHVCRIPMNRGGDMIKFYRRLERNLQENCGNVDIKSISKELNIREDVLKDLLVSFIPPINLDSIVGRSEEDGGDGTRRYERVVSENSDYESEFYDGLRDKLSGMIENLDEREARVLKLYYGFDGEEPMVLEDIGKILGVTRERVRQIRDAALNKLKRRGKREGLEDYL